MTTKINLFTLTLTLALTQSVNAQHGVHPDWGPDVELPRPGVADMVRGYLYGNMGVFSNNKRIVFLNESPNTTHYTYSYDGLNWTPAALFGPTAMTVGGGDIKTAMGYDDHLHVVWTSNIPTGLYYSKLDSALNVVIDSVRIASATGPGILRAMYPSVDRSGNLHVTWHEGDPNVVVSECYYSKSTDGGQTWWAPILLSDDQDGKSDAFPRGQFKACDGDTLAIAWRNHTSTTPDHWDIQMVTSTDSGMTWSAPTTVAGGTDDQGDPDIVVDPQNRIHLWYHHAPRDSLFDGIRVVYGYSDDLGASWTPSNSFYNNWVCRNERSYLVEGSRFDVTTGYLWTFWKEEDLMGQQGGDFLSAWSWDRGDTWVTPEYVTDRHDTTIGFKAITLMPGGGIAANYELPNYPNAGHLRVFYKERQPLPLPVNRPQPASEVSIFPNPTSGHITVSWGRMEVQKVEVLNALGQRIATYAVGLAQSGVEIDLPAQVRGVCYLRLHGASETVTRRLLRLAAMH